MEKITSKDNNLIKHIKKLKEKKYRSQFNQYIVEGEKMANEAIDENMNIKKIIICCDNNWNFSFKNNLAKKIQKYDCILVKQNIFKLISNVETPQGIICIIENSKFQNCIDLNSNLIICLDNIQDPGNLGTILRTIDSAGLNQVLISKNSVDCYNPKVIRSTMGAIFRINIIETDNLEKSLINLKNNGFKIMCTSLDSNKTIYDVNYSKSVIVMGNEANGVSKEILDLADEKLIIPMPGKTESLNVSVATGIILYEYVRQNL